VDRTFLRGFRTLIDTGLMAPSSIGSIGAWVRLLLELNADLSTKHSISSSGALSGPVWGMKTSSGAKAGRPL
jgi:hypothetical protein